MTVLRSCASRNGTVPCDRSGDRYVPEAGSYHCAAHAARHRRTGRFNEDVPLNHSGTRPRRHQTCTARNGDRRCGLPHYQHGYCVGHFTRWYRNDGRLDEDTPLRRRSA